MATQSPWRFVVICFNKSTDFAALFIAEIGCETCLGIARLICVSMQ